MPSRIRARAGRARPVTAERAIVRARPDTPADDLDLTPECLMKDRKITNLRELRKACEDHGAIVSETAKGLRVQGPAGPAFISADWGDPRARHNAIHDVKRYAGIDLSQPAGRNPIGEQLLDVAVKRTARAAVDTAPPKLIVQGRTARLDNGDPLEDAPVPAPRTADHVAPPVDPDVRALEELLTEAVDTLTAEIGTLRGRVADLEADRTALAAELEAALEAGLARTADPTGPVDPLAAERAQVWAFLRTMPTTVNMRASFVADQTGLPSATVRTILRAAADAGELTEQRGQGKGRPSTYRLPAAALSSAAGDR